MDLVLDEEINQWHKSAEEGASKVLSILDGPRVGRAQSETPRCPRDGEYYVCDHEDIVPVVIIRRSDIGPPTTGESPEDTEERNRRGQGPAGLPRQEVP